MNRADSERIAGHLENKGVILSEQLENADIVIVNMCSVRQASVDRVFGLAEKMRSLKEEKPGLLTVLTGCTVTQDKRKFKPVFDGVIGIDSVTAWLDMAAGLNGKIAEPLAKNQGKDSKFSVMIPISAGCDNFCSYCVVPYTRGPLVSRDWRDILGEARNAVDSGAKEIWLLGQNVNNYHFVGRDKTDTVDFPALIRMVNDIPGNFWIRFTSPHPKDFNDDAINAVASSAKVTPYFNLPVQSGDDSVLKAMARPYTAAQYLKLVENLRKAYLSYRTGPESMLALSTDVIVGFPNETQVNFANTAALFEKVGFDMAYIARYSPRSGTAAASLPDNVPTQEKQRRFRELTKILFKTSQINNEQYLGKKLPVMIDGIFDKNGLWAMAKTRSYKTVKFRLGAPMSYVPGDIVNVRISKALPLGLAAELV